MKMQKLLFVFLLCLCAPLIFHSDAGATDSPNPVTISSQLQSGVSGLPFAFSDMRLRGAAGAAVISPTPQNHPCTMFLGGTSQNRLATGIHDDLEARALVLSEGAEYFILVSMDLVGWSIADVGKVHDALESYGIDRNRVVISSSHTHAGPDTMGIWGADLVSSGRCTDYVDFLVDTVVDLVLQTVQDLVPVTAYADDIAINEPGSNYTNLNRDSRDPKITNDHLTVARFADKQGRTVATLVNWGSHPEVMISSREYSADFIHWTRNKLEEVYGGTSVYISGTVGGLTTVLGVAVRQYTQDGEPVLNGQDPVWISSDNETKAWSFGYVIAEWVMAALEDPVELEGRLVVKSTEVYLPMQNPWFYLALVFGIIEWYDVVHQPWDLCGLIGCLVQPIQHIQLGQLHLVTLPGEAYSETAVGRPESVKDYGEPWGEHVFPAIEGYRERLPDGHFMMDIGLANNEIGYITPRNDFHFPDHPDFYEEFYFFNLDAETILREAIYDLLQ